MVVILIHQEVLVYDCLLEKGKLLTHELNSNRGIWIQVTDSKLEVSGKTLKAGDGASIEKESVLKFSTDEKAEFLLFDLG